MDGRYRPGSLKELEQLVAWAVAEETPLEVAGAGSKRGYGRPVEAARGVSTAGLAGIDMYEPHELVMSAGAGTPLAEVERELEERGQELAFEPGDLAALLGEEPGRQTIGGVFACNLAGPRRLKAGAARDHLLGLQLVTGHGQVIKTGGRVVKNVTGYDLAKLLTGSFGTLAVMSHLTFKVLPAAEDEATVVLAGDDLPALLAALRQAMATYCEVSGAAVLPAPATARSAVGLVKAAGRAMACLRVEGAGPSVAYRAERLEDAFAGSGFEIGRLDRGASKALWREVRDGTLLDGARPCLWRISVPPTDAAPLLERLEGDFLFDWAGGLVWLAVDEAAPECVRGALPTTGHATLVRAPEAVRREVEVFHPQPAPLKALSERVKNSFDPKRILNPGRMMAGL